MEQYAISTRNHKLPVLSFSNTEERFVLECRISKNTKIPENFVIHIIALQSLLLIYATRSKVYSNSSLSSRAKCLKRILSAQIVAYPICTFFFSFFFWKINELIRAYRISHFCANTFPSSEYVPQFSVYVHVCRPITVCYFSPFLSPHPNEPINNALMQYSRMYLLWG